MNFFDNHDPQFRTSQSMAKGFMPQVFAWMCAGLMTSTVVAYLLSPVANPALFKKLIGGPMMFLLLAQLGLIFFYSYKWKELSFGTSAALFMSYSALTGVTLSPLAYMYTGASLMQTFLVAAGTFGVMAVYGWVTDCDLSQYSSLLTMGVLGLLLAMFVNFFVQSSGANLLISAAGALIFTVLIAYDVQKLKYISRFSPEDSSMRGKIALMGALHLYLDVINLFLFLVRLLGDRRR